MKDLNHKEFKPTSWAIDNKTSIYVVMAIITIMGLFSYQSLPKEQFPEVVFPQIYVATIYPGTTPSDMENLVSKQIEKQVKAISGVKKVTSVLYRISLTLLLNLAPMWTSRKPNDW